MFILDASNLIQDTNILAHLSEQPQVQLSLQVGLGFGSPLRLAVRTSGRHHGPMSVPVTRRRRLEIKLQNMVSVTMTTRTRTKLTGELRKGTSSATISSVCCHMCRCRDGAQDQEQTLEIGDTTDFGQHEDDLYGEYGGEAQEDRPSQGMMGCQQLT